MDQLPSPSIRMPSSTPEIRSSSVVSCLPGSRETFGIRWNGTLDQGKWGGDPLLDRDVTLGVDGLPAGRWLVRHHRVDEVHSNIRRTWEVRGGSSDWPDEAGWAALREADRLEPLEPERELVVGDDGQASLEFPMPMPSLSLVELIPAR